MDPRPVRYTRPKKISDVVATLLAKRGYGRVLEVEQYAEIWLAAVGETLAGQSRAVELRRNVLHVLAANSAVLQELTFQRKTIVKQLAEIAPSHAIKDLKVKVAALD